MEFWLAAGGMTLVVAALLLLALMRRRGPEPVPGSEDVQVYRDQLKEIGRDLERGTIPAEEGERLRTEVSRRLLEADRQLAAARPAREAPSTATAVIALALVVVFAAAVMLYQRLGAPGYPDLPIAERLADARAAMANRPDQAAAEKQVPPVPAPQNVDPAFLQLMEKLRKAVADRPEDVTGHRLLAENELRLGNFHAAWVAQGEVVRLKAATATAQDYADLADMMILAAGGYVSPEAETALKEALKRDPKNGVARFYAGLMFGQNGRPDLTFQLWKPLLDEGPADAPWIAPIRGQIEAVAAAAGVRYSLPPATGANGPSAADVAAAQNMTPEERQQMIRGMVAQLADRLDSQGGSAAEWARLIGAYGVLGETEKARAAWEAAKAAYAGKAGDLATIDAAAGAAGLSP